MATSAANAASGMTTTANSGWKCSSSSCSPMKYQGAFAGFGLMPGFAGGPSPAANSSAVTSTTAVSTSPTAVSRASRSGTNSVVSGFSSGVSSNAYGTTTPRALRTRQKWKAIRATSSTGRTVVWSV